MGIVLSVASKAVWRQRVKAWRASGQRSEDFCMSREFSAALLRHWAWRLGLTRRRGKKDEHGAEPVRLARVVRKEPPTAVRPGDARAASGAIRIEVGRARVEVLVGVDAATLATVLAVLEGRATGSEVRP